MAKGNKAGLTRAEAVLVDRLRTIAHWIARGLTNAEIVLRIQDQFKGPNNQKLREGQARGWIIKAREYIADTAEADLESRELYLRRLEDLMKRCQENLITDVEEITVVSGVPASAEDDPAGTGEGVAKSKEGKRYRRRFQKAVFNGQAGNLLFRVMREHAIVSGARPRDKESNGPKLVVNNDNRTVNVAAAVSSAPARDLLTMIGANEALEVVEPSSTDEGRLVPGEAEEADGPDPQGAGWVQEGPGGAPEPGGEGAGVAGG